MTPREAGVPSPDFVAAVMNAQAAEIAKLKEQVAWQRLLIDCLDGDRIIFMPMFDEIVVRDKRNDEYGHACEYVDGLPIETPELRAALEAALAAGGKADE